MVRVRRQTRAVSQPRREPKRDAVRSEVLERILKLDLEPASKINESRLAKELGVSRTPLREALLSLEREGFVHSEVNLGFRVASLTLQEAREVYPILWTLEGLALRESGALASTMIPDLEKANARLERSSRTPDRALEADARFHSCLLAGCPNRRLVELIGAERRVLERFERVYMRDATLIPHSVAQHKAIIEAVRIGAIDVAVAALERNWRFALEALSVRLSR